MRAASLTAADTYRAIYKTLWRMNERHWRWAVRNFANDNLNPLGAA